MRWCCAELSPPVSAHSADVAGRTRPSKRPLLLGPRPSSKSGWLRVHGAGGAPTQAQVLPRGQELAPGGPRGAF